MIDDTLIPLLRCPKTKQPLRRATLQEKQAQSVPDAEDALVSMDGSCLYRTVNELPVLLTATDAAV